MVSENFRNEPALICVPRAGIEPALQRNWILNPARLPIPPPGHFTLRLPPDSYRDPPPGHFTLRLPPDSYRDPPLGHLIYNRCYTLKLTANIQKELIYCSFQLDKFPK